MFSVTYNAVLTANVPEIKWPKPVVDEAKLRYFFLSWVNHPISCCALASVLAATGRTSAGYLFYMRASDSKWKC